MKNDTSWGERLQQKSLKNRGIKRTFRLCLKDNSSIHIIAESLEDIHNKLENNKFIKTRDGELIASNYVRFVRVSSKTVEEIEKHNSKLKINKGVE